MDANSEYFNAKIETMQKEESEAYQQSELWKQLSYVADKSTFYQEKYRENEIDLLSIKTMEDFRQLPFTEKSELRDSQINFPPLGKQITVPMSEVARVYSTSGTTGRPTYIGLTRNDVEVWKEATGRALWTGGLRPGNIVPLVVAPFLIAASYADAIEHIGATVVPIGVRATDRLIGAFQNIGANAFLSTSSFPMHFADSLRRRGIDPRSLGIKVILAGGEPGAAIPEYRQQVEEAFGCIFLEMMGNGDVCGEIFSECRYKHGMHLTASGIVYVEIIDPDSGEALDIEEGASGELVYTTLRRECMPLVRFRSRDHAVVTQTSCECGRTGFSIRCVGRTDDMMIIQGVNVYPSAIKDIVSDFSPRTTGAIEVQITKRPPEGWQPPIWIKVETGDSPGEHPVQLKTAIEAAIQEKLIFRANIELVPKDSLPKYEYKAQLVRKLYEENA